MKIHFLANFALGCFLGSIFSLSLAWVIDESVATAYQKNWVYLFSALTTLAAAALALSGTFSVIHNQKELAASENAKSLLAARAALPPVLSSLTKKATLGFDACSNQLTLKTTPHVARDTLEKLTLTTDELAVLTSCIKYCDDDTARWLSLIISHLQILYARLDSNLFTAGLLPDDMQIAGGALD